MVVTGDNQHPAMRGGSVGIAMFQCVAGSIDPGTFAVPEAEHAIDLTLGIAFDLLRSQHCGGGKILVDGGQKLDATIR